MCTFLIGFVSCHCAQVWRSEEPFFLFFIISWFSAVDALIRWFWRCRLPGAGGGPGALPDRLPDEAAVGEQGRRGEPGSAAHQVWPGADRFVQQAGAAYQSTLTPDLLSRASSIQGWAPGHVLIPTRDILSDTGAAPSSCWGPENRPVERGIKRKMPHTHFRSV